MARVRLDKNVVVEKAVQLANSMGLEAVTLKLLVDSLHIQPPSLYNHIKGLDDLQKKLMLYGWRHMEERPLDYGWVLSIREQCLLHGVHFEFRQCGTHFVKDVKTYTLQTRNLCSQARIANINC